MEGLPGRAAVITGLAVVLLAGCAASSGLLTDTVDATDPLARTILVGGRTIVVPEGFDFDAILAGSRYRVRYGREDGGYVLTGIEETSGSGSRHGDN